MNLSEAEKAIGAILDQIPAHLLPQPSRVESARHDEYGDCHWFGSHGYYVGSCRDGKGNSIPDNHRRSAVNDLFERETMQRLEDKFWADKPTEAAGR